MQVGGDMQGWIKIHRKLICSQTFQNEKLLKVWIYCLLKATHQEHTQRVGRQKVILQPGQFVFGRNKAAEELNMKPSTVWDYMQMLRDEKNIDIKSNNKYSVVTVVNWELYQMCEENSDNKTNNKSTTNRQQIDTNKNDKNDKNNNIYNSIFEVYNRQGIITHKELTDKMKKAINRAVKNNKPEDITKAIERYGQAYRDTGYKYCNYKMTLDKFLTQSNGYTDWLDEGQKWINYKGSQKKECSDLPKGWKII